MAEPDRPALERDFDFAMRKIYDDAKREAGYTATRFIQMVAERGGLDAARRLLAAPQVSDGFTTLVMAGRADLTVEHLVTTERFRPLFNRTELREAERRLR